MKQVLVKKGKVIVEKVPAPQVQPGNVLVRVSHSCISTGTEMSGIHTSEQPLWKRALQNPKVVKNVIQMAASEGIGHTTEMVQGTLAIGKPLGYSAAGTVVEIGEGVDHLLPGDRVACAGAQCAFHAEIISVPANLTVTIPMELNIDVASTVTLGAIALQGVRRANPTLGETFVVVGLGILGQITSQILLANGCRVIGTDLLPSRVQLAKKLGMHIGLSPDEEDFQIENVRRLTDSIGADGVIITAATSSESVLSSAFNMCRKKGRVVLVGDVGLNLNRADIYKKELDFFISTSYGPGRYDKNYEENGFDYPIGYVRWTENRNMAEYLRLLAEKKVAVRSLISATFKVDEAEKAYEAIKHSEDPPLMVLLSYPSDKEDDPTVRTVINPTANAAGSGQIRVAVVGAGAFAKGMHLPNLKKLRKLFHIQAVLCQTGHNAASIAKQYGADYSTTVFAHLLDDAEVDAVLISTRHHLHASMALSALRAGKHVLVEKPLSLTREELEKFKPLFNILNLKNKAEPIPLLLTGFNRRFSPFLKRIEKWVEHRTHPMIINYRMNAGNLPADHWFYSEQGGGRNLGEACHIYDLFTFLTDSKVVSIDAQTIQPTRDFFVRKDNFVTTMTFADGSLATLTYTSMGDTGYPKEKMEVFVDGMVIALDNYKKLEVHGIRGKGMETKTAEKGHKEELESFAQTIQAGGDWPIPLWQQIQATEIALQVEELLNSPTHR